MAWHEPSAAVGKELPQEPWPSFESRPTDFIQVVRGWRGGEEGEEILSLLTCSAPYWQGTLCGTVYRGQPRSTHRAGQEEWRTDLETSRPGLSAFLRGESVARAQPWAEELGVASAGTWAEEPPRSAER